MFYLSMFVVCVGLGYLFEIYISKRHELIKTIQKASEDGVLCQDDLSKINSKATELGLSLETVQAERLAMFNSQISQALVRSRVQGFMTSLDYDLIQSKARSFGLSMRLENNVLMLVYKGMLKERGQIDLFDLTDEQTSIRGQKIIFKTEARWDQGARVRLNTGTVHAGASFRIAKGLYVHTGKSVPTSHEYEGYKTISTGTMVLTQEAIHFIGNARSQKIRFDEISSVKWYSDGLKVFYEEGSPELYVMGESCAELLRLVFSEAMGGNDQQAEVLLEQKEVA